jgi:cytochrome c biogenesis protein
VICLGGLIDGNLPLKFKELRGELRAETRNIPASEVPAESTLGVDNPSFRGSVNIPEGRSSSVVFLQLRDGYLVQQLPFAIELQEFRVEHYPSGMPKSFESDLIIHDPERDEPLAKTIRVNHPLIYKGYAIYQSSFGDGGSGLNLRAWSLDRAHQDPIDLQSRVERALQIKTTRGDRTLEFTDFKPYNIFPAQEGDTRGKKFRNYGPSLIFRVRNPAGEALEYENYMAPVEVEGRMFFMSGMRASPAESFRYLYIPADPTGSPRRFMQLLAAAQDQVRVREVIVRQLDGTLEQEDGGEELREKMTESIGRLLQLFVTDGIAGIVRHAEENVPQEQRQSAIDSYVNVLQGVLGTLYLDVLRAEGVDTEQGIGEAESQFYDDALNALSILGAYESPIFLQLASFDHVEASGLQIARSPGKNIVYFGCALLMIGVFMMFYIHQRRLWVYLVPDANGGTRLLFAGSGLRRRADFEQEFIALRDEAQKATASAGLAIE